MQKVQSKHEMVVCLYPAKFLTLTYFFEKPVQDTMLIYMYNTLTIFIFHKNCEIIFQNIYNISHPICKATFSHLTLHTENESIVCSQEHSIVFTRAY